MIKQSGIMMSLSMCVTPCYEKTVKDNDVSASVCDSML